MPKHKVFDDSDSDDERAEDAKSSDECSQATSDGK